MCGIAGFIETNVGHEKAQENVRKMLDAIKHRGPDNSEVWQQDAVTLGHNRLSIIDLSEAANQPFEYDDVVIVFNGEIYNYIEIRQQLEVRGFKFETQGDTEVICAAYKAWGTRCVEQFVGMWAFALWDKSRQELFCSRDRFGIKPFYFFTTDTGFYFASEYKALKVLECFDNELNYDQLKLGIALNFVSCGNQTYYKDLVQLEPAHSLVVNDGGVEVDRYWDISFGKKVSLSFEEKCAQFEALFFDSIRLHARSDVRNGICLSGGLDSSAIASVYSKLFSDVPIQSFSIYYEGKGKVDERPFVRSVVEKYPTVQPHYFSPKDDDIAGAFVRAAYAADVPLLGSSYISQYFLMQLAASKGVKVVLDGQGSDEYLGGYLHSFYRTIGSKLKNFEVGGALGLLNRLGEREGFGLQRKGVFLLKSLVSCLSDEKEMYGLEAKKYESLTGSFFFDLTKRTDDKFDDFLYQILMETTLQTLLHHEDRNSMAFSIESRVPFLDHRLVEFAFSLLTEDRISNKAETKYILREGLKGVLPKAVYERKDKKGFVTPGEVEWLNGPLRFLLEDDFGGLDFMNIGEAKRLVEQYKGGDFSKAGMVWKLAATNHWIKRLA